MDDKPSPRASKQTPDKKAKKDRKKDKRSDKKFDKKTDKKVDKKTEKIENNDKTEKIDKAEKNEKKNTKKKSNTGWIVAAFSMSFGITAVLSAASDKVVSALPIFVAAAVLIGIIFLGIIFDIIGLAVTTADIRPFNSMAARRLKSGQKAVWLINNAEKVSSFCNDIVGDIAGVVSGATGAGIAVKLFSSMDTDIAFLLTLMLTSLISAVTVGGKAFGKSVAIKHSTNIVMTVSKLLSGFKD